MSLAFQAANLDQATPTAPGRLYIQHPLDNALADDLSNAALQHRGSSSAESGTSVRASVLRYKPFEVWPEGMTCRSAAMADRAHLNLRLPQLIRGRRSPEIRRAQTQ